MASPSNRSSLVPMLIIGALFFIFGFITWLNGALIPFLKIVCNLTQTEAILIASCFYIAYFVMALPMSWVLERTGFKHAMVLGLLIIATGFILFIPAAETQMFGIFLLAQFVVGSGLTILQTASNPYVVKVGPQKSAAARISIMGLLNKGAGVIAPMVFTSVVLGQFSGVSAESMQMLPAAEQARQVAALANGLIHPYLGMAMAMLVLAVLLKFSNLPEINLSEDHGEEVNVTSDDKSSVWQFPYLVIGVFTLFIYVGVEVIAGDTIGLFGAKLNVPNATSLTSFTMVFMVIGYILGLVLIPRVIKQHQALFGSAVLGVILSLLVVFSSHQDTSVSDILWGWSGLQTLPNTVTYVALLGLANAIMWPAIWPLALDGLGKWTPRGSAMLIMAIAGGALLPLLYGHLSETFSAQQAYWMMVPCYLIILFYAVKGHKITRWR